jgi:hypothetical protein
MLVGSADAHRMLMVMIVEPALLGSMSIHKGECGVEELQHVVFFGRRHYAFIILFIVGLVRVALGSASAVFMSFMDLMVLKMNSEMVTRQGGVDDEGKVIISYSRPQECVCSTHLAIIPFHGLLLVLPTPA